MRKLLISLLAVLILCSGCAAGEETAPQFIRTYSHQDHLTNGVVTGTNDFYYQFNSQGLVTCLETYRDDTLFSRSTWEYDEFGNIIHHTEEQDGTIKEYDYKIELDEAGRMLRQEIWLGDVRTRLREITYNRQGEEATHHVTAWHEDGQLDGSGDYTMTYNWKGELTREVHLREPGDSCVWEYQDGLCVRQTSYEAETHAITDYWEYTYDNKDRCIRESHHAGDGTLELYHEYVYDDAARTKVRTCYRADGTVDTYSDTYTYDEHGNEIMLERFQDGEVYWRIQNTYELLETAAEGS